MDTLPDELEDTIDYVPRYLLWHEIRETLEFKSARVLLMSSRLYDVQLASRLVKCSVIESMSAEVVNHALKEGNEEIILYLSTQECFNFKKHAQKAFTGGLMVEVDDEIWWDDYPLSTFRLLTNPSLGLKLDYITAMERAIKRGDLEVVQFLATLPEVDVLNRDYLYDAVYDGVLQPDIFLFLLDLDGMVADQDLIDMTLEAYNSYLYSNTSFYDALKANPKTREYVLAYEARPTPHGREFPDSDSD